MHFAIHNMIVLLFPPGVSSSTKRRKTTPPKKKKRVENPRPKGKKNMCIWNKWPQEWLAIFLFWKTGVSHQETQGPGTKVQFQNVICISLWVCINSVLETPYLYIYHISLYIYIYILTSLSLGLQKVCFFPELLDWGIFFMCGLGFLFSVLGRIWDSWRSMPVMVSTCFTRSEHVGNSSGFKQKTQHVLAKICLCIDNSRIYGRAIYPTKHIKS